MGHGRGMMPGEKAKDFKGTMGKLLGYLKKFLPGIVLVLICAAASTIFSIFGPKVLGQATTKLFEGLIAMPPVPVSMILRRLHRSFSFWQHSISSARC